MDSNPKVLTSQSVSTSVFRPQNSNTPTFQHPAINSTLISSGLPYRVHGQKDLTKMASIFIGSAGSPDTNDINLLYLQAFEAAKDGSLDHLIKNQSSKSILNGVIFDVAFVTDLMRQRNILLLPQLYKAGLKKEEAIKAINASFASIAGTCCGLIVIYSGHGTSKNGDWCFANHEVLSFREIMDLWEQSIMCKIGGTLIIISDSCHSGSFCDILLSKYMDINRYSNVAVLASSQANEASIDSDLGGIFLRNWVVGNGGRSVEPPAELKHQPVLASNFDLSKMPQTLLHPTPLVSLDFLHRASSSFVSIRPLVNEPEQDASPAPQSSLLPLLPVNRPSTAIHVQSTNGNIINPIHPVNKPLNRPSSAQIQIPKPLSSMSLIARPSPFLAPLPTAPMINNSTHSSTTTSISLDLESSIVQTIKPPSYNISTTEVQQDTMSLIFDSDLIASSTSPNKKKPLPKTKKSEDNKQKVDSASKSKVNSIRKKASSKSGNKNSKH